MHIRWIETTRSGQWIEKDIHEIKDSEIENTNHKHQLVLTEKRDQIIEGFGGSFNELGWIALNKIGSNQKEKIIKSLFDEEEGANFNFCRLPIGASDYAAKWYSHNEHPNDFEMQFFSIERDYDYLLPYVKKALKYKKDLKLLLRLGVPQHG